MPAGFTSLLLGTVYACMGLSGLRLARLNGQGLGWRRFCIAGIVSALSEWHALYSAAHGIRQPNDLVGSLLALLALVAWAEFARRAAEHHLHPSLWIQLLMGAGAAGFALAAFAAFNPGGSDDFYRGFYPRLLFAQHTVGIFLTALSLALFMPRKEAGDRWIRLAGTVLFAGLAGFCLLYAADVAPDVMRLPLIPSLAAAAILLRTACIVRGRESRRALSRWAFLELTVLTLLLIGAAFNARQSGRKATLAEMQNLLKTCEVAAAAFEPGHVEAVKNGSTDSDFQALSLRLLAIRQSTRTTAAENHESRRVFIVVLQNEEAVFLGVQPDRLEHPIRPGDPFDEVCPELQRAFKEGKSFIEGPANSHFGNRVSAFAPIRNSDGQILALLGIDFDAGEWGRIAANAELTVLLRWTLAMMIALSLFTTVGLVLEAQRQLRDSERLFRTAADYTSTWDYWVGADGRMIYTSLAGKKVTGYAPGEFLHHPRRLLKIVDPGDRRRMIDHLRSCASDAPACEFDFKIIRKDGKPAWIKHSCEAVYDDHGRWSGRRASNRDITTQRAAELALARQERLLNGCHRAQRLLLGTEGSRRIAEALDLATRAGDCIHAAIFRIGDDQHVRPLSVWPPGSELPRTTVWESWKERALPILSVGESFELSSEETRDFSGALAGSQIVILPILEHTRLTGAVAFAAPESRGPWSRAEIAALATLAGGFSVALEHGEIDGA